jgi:hypothetical protein
VTADQKLDYHWTKLHVADIQTFAQSRAPAKVALVWCAVLVHDRSRTGVVWPKQATIAEMTGLSVRTVGRHMAVLVEHHLVKLKYRYKMSPKIAIRGRCPEDVWQEFEIKHRDYIATTTDGTSKTGQQLATQSRQPGHSVRSESGTPVRTTVGRPEVENEVEKEKRSETTSPITGPSEEKMPEKVGNVIAEAKALRLSDRELSEPDSIDLAQRKMGRRQKEILAEHQRRKAEEAEAKRLADNPAELASRLPPGLRKAYLAQKKISND